MKTFKQILHETSCESDDYGSEMTKRELQVALNAASELMSMIEQGYPIERWNESKITIASDYLVSVCTYMKTLSPAPMSSDDYEDTSDAPFYVGHEYDHTSPVFPFVYEQVEVKSEK